MSMAQNYLKHLDFHYMVAKDFSRQGKFECNKIEETKTNTHAGGKRPHLGRLRTCSASAAAALLA